jgi:hypothetical protein
MTDKKTTDDDAEDATAPTPAIAEDTERAPVTDAAEGDAAETPIDGPPPKDQDDEDDAPVRDPWDDPEDAVAADVTPRVDPLELEVEPEKDRPEDAVSEDVVPEDVVPEDEVPEDEVPEDAVPEDQEDADAHEDYEDHPRPSLAARALRALVILLIGGGAALWAAPKVAPMLPVSVSKHLVVAVPVEVSEFDAYRQEASARIAGLEAALEDRAQMLGEKIEDAGKSGLTGPEVQAVVDAATDALAADLKALDETLANGDLSGLAARIAGLETQVAGLTRQLDSLAGGLANVGAETGEVGEMSQAAVARLAANAAQIDGLRGQIEQLSQQSGALAQRLEQATADAAARIAKAETDAAASADAAAADASAVKAAAVARARMATNNAALDEITASIDAGTVFTDALTRIETPAPETLATAAAAGVSTNAALRIAFTPAAHEAIRADAVAGAGGGAFDKLVAGVTAQFIGVPTGATGGDGVDAILGEASGKLAEDDVAGAIATLDRLTPEAAAPMADWIARARLRGDAKSALADWRAALTKTDG